jgi:hypothetical protein
MISDDQLREYALGVISDSIQSEITKILKSIDLSALVKEVARDIISTPGTVDAIVDELKTTVTKHANNNLLASNIVWNNYKLSGNNVKSGTIAEFSSTGIRDSASSTVVKVTNEGLTVRGDILANSITADSVTISDSLQLSDNAVLSVSRAVSSLLEPKFERYTTTNSVQQLLDNLDIESVVASSAKFGKLESAAMRDNTSYPHRVIELTDTGIQVEKLSAVSVCTESVESDTISTVDLTVTGDLFLPDDVWESLVGSVAESIDTTSAKLTGDLTLNGTVVLTTDELGPTVTKSNIRQLGNLTELVVAGETTLGGTLFSSKSGRVGINTTSPDSALTVWDEETKLSVGKFKKQTVGILTSGADIVIGSRNSAGVTITGDTLSVPKIKVGKYEVMFSDSEPSCAGSRGDVCFNTSFDGSLGTPAAWTCIGGTRWVNWP